MTDLHRCNSIYAFASKTVVCRLCLWTVVFQEAHKQAYTHSNRLSKIYGLLTMDYGQSHEAHKQAFPQSIRLNACASKIYGLLTMVYGQSHEAHKQASAQSIRLNACASKTVVCRLWTVDTKH